MAFIEHKYGPKFRIIDNSFLQGALAKLCSPNTYQPEINRLVHLLYTHLIGVVINEEFKHASFSQETRMTELHPDQFLEGKRIDPNQSAICVNLARAGTFPSHICYDFLHFCLPPQNLRQDHIFAARVTDDDAKVKGTHLGSHKIGGGARDSIVLFPDPMGATGNTIASAVSYYKEKLEGPAKKYIALNLIITPEYIRKMQSSHKDLIVYAIRLDRGLSSERALKATPGEFISEERGLNDKHYIVPGGGGFGEILNNSFV